MSQPQPQHQGSTRSVDQVALERAMGEVSNVLLLIEHALDRAKKGLKIIKKDGVDSNAELAMTVVVADLDRVRKRLLQDTYFAGDSLRLL